jgi:hypothetical protein
VKLYVPFWFGVPEIVPVVAARSSPGGSVPEEMLQV